MLSAQFINGKTLRVRNAGVPLLNNSDKRGDLYIKVYIEIPKHISKEEKIILERFRDMHGENNRPLPTKINNKNKLDDFFNYFR